MPTTSFVMPKPIWTDARPATTPPWCRLGAVVAAALAGVAVVACSPAFNWRDIRVPNAALTVPFPCKPDRAERPVAWFGAQTPLHMLSCDHRGLTFAAGVLALPSGASVADAHASLQRAALASLRRTPEHAQPWVPRIAATAPADVRGWTVLGQRPDGQPLPVHALTWVRGSHLVHLSVYGSVSPEVLDQWLEGLRPDATGR